MGKCKSSDKKCKSSGDLTPQQKRGLSMSGVVQVALLIYALVDIARRPEKEIRGSKGAWAAASFVNFVGPISYFIFGRKR